MQSNMHCAKDRPDSGVAGTQGRRPGLMRAVWTNTEQRGGEWVAEGETDMLVRDRYVEGGS